MLDISIIVVSYNTLPLTLACLRSLYEQIHTVTFEVIVIENDSNDGSGEAVAREFPKVRLFAEFRNHGFAAANNLAAKSAIGEYLLLLNPDTLILDGAVQKLVAFARARPDVGIVGGRTLRGDGSLDPTSCWGKSTPWSVFCQATGLAGIFPRRQFFNSEAIPGWNRDTFREVDIVTGCLLLIRRDLWERLGGFDPAFFMYAEEADLCLRAKKLGIRCGICPDAEIIHFGGASEKVLTDKIVRLFVAKRLLFSRHWSRAWVRPGGILLDIWAFGRMILYSVQSCFRQAARDKFETWRTVWRRRDSWQMGRSTSQFVGTQEAACRVPKS